VRVVRDIYSSEFERAIVDDPKQHHRLVSFFSRTAPELVEHVELWEGDQPLFEAFGIEQVLDSTLERRVDLPSGGYLMIDYAEALTVIDVNTGSFIGRGKGARLEDTITKTNLEAAEEVVRQLRLRDIGGMIVIDFIDMARARNRDAVLKLLRKSLDEDRTKTFVVEISPLGLVEMTRQNVTDGVREIMTRPCPTCDGEGVIKSEETIAIEFERRLRDLATETSAEAILLQINPRVSAEFTGNDARALRAIEEEGMRRRSAEITLAVPTAVALYILNQKREALTQIEARYGFSVQITNDDELVPPSYRLDRLTLPGIGAAAFVLRIRDRLGNPLGWRLKPLHRLLVLSSTYQTSAACAESDEHAVRRLALFGRWRQRRLLSSGDMSQHRSAPPTSSRPTASCPAARRTPWSITPGRGLSISR